MSDGAPIIVQFEEEIAAVIDKYSSEGVSVGGVVGALENQKLLLLLKINVPYIKVMLEKFEEET